jgi:hypothetical protein
MAQDIVSGLFGMSPFQVEQQQRNQINQQASEFARMPAVQRGVMGLYQGGAGLANAGAGMMGMVNPEVEQAKMREQALSGLDMSSPESIMQRAQQITDPQLKMKLQMLAQQKMAERQKMQAEAAKTALAERKQDFTEKEAFDLKKQTELEKLRLREMEIVNKAEQAEREGRSTEMYRQQLLELRRMGLAIQQQKSSAPPKLTVGQQAVDREFGKEYAEYVAAGGFSDVAKQVKQLEQVQSELEKKGNDYTGPAVGLIPDKARSFTNPAAVAAKNKVEEVAQRNLRLVLGAQFTQVEGERLIARAYNPSMPPEENAARVKALAEQIKTAARQKAEAADYFEKNGTLSGWSGKLPSVSDFEEAIDKAGGKRESSGKVSSSPSGVDPKVWAVMTPEEKALWKK